MTELHGVFPYLVSPIDATGRVNSEVLARLADDLDRCRRARADAARLDRRIRLSQQLSSAPTSCARPSKQQPAASRSLPALRPPRRPMRSRKRAIMPSSAPTASWRSSNPTFPLADAQVEAYFRAIADAVDIPVVLYTNPQFQRSDLSLDVIARLGEHPRIRYIKDASTNTGRLLSIMNRCPRLKVFSASAHIPAAVMLIGGVGWMAGPACVIPRQSVRLYELCRAGQWPQAMELQRALWRINEIFARFNLAACIKAALHAAGLRRRRSGRAAAAARRRRTAHRGGRARRGCHGRRGDSGLTGQAIHQAIVNFAEPILNASLLKLALISCRHRRRGHCGIDRFRTRVAFASFAVVGLGSAWPAPLSGCASCWRTAATYRWRGGLPEPRSSFASRARCLRSSRRSYWRAGSAASSSASTSTSGPGCSDLRHGRSRTRLGGAAPDSRIHRASALRAAARFPPRQPVAGIVDCDGGWRRCRAYCLWPVAAYQPKHRVAALHRLRRAADLRDRAGGERRRAVLWLGQSRAQPRLTSCGKFCCWCCSPLRSLVGLPMNAAIATWPLRPRGGPSLSANGRCLGGG